MFCSRSTSYDDNDDNNNVECIFSGRERDGAAWLTCCMVYVIHLDLYIYNIYISVQYGFATLFATEHRLLYLLAAMAGGLVNWWLDCIQCYGFPVGMCVILPIQRVYIQICHVFSNPT